MGIDILPGLRTVEVREYTVDIDPLAYRCITLQPQLLVPELCLADEDQCHRAHRIETVIQEEAEFLECLFLQKVGLVQYTDDLFVPDAPDDLDLFLELTFGVSPVEAGLQPQLVQEAFIEPSRCQLGVGQVQEDVLVPGKATGELPDQGGFSAARVCRDHGE